MKRLLLALLFSAGFSTTTVHGLEEVIILEKPVRIVTSSSPEIFPEAWRKLSVSPEGGALPENQIERARTP